MFTDRTAVRSYFTALFPLIIGIIIFFMIEQQIQIQSIKRPLSGVVKIFMNYLDIFFASSFEINWPEIVLNLFDRTKDFSSPRISFYSSDYNWLELL